MKNEGLAFSPIFEARVIEADNAKRVCKVQLSTEQIIEGVKYGHGYASLQRGISGQAGLSRGDLVIIAKTYERSWVTIAATTYATSAKSDPKNPDEASSGPRDDFSAGRQPIGGGDQGWLTGNGGFILARANGDLEIVANEACWTRYFPSEFAVKSVIGQAQTTGFWGYADAFVDRDDERDKAGTTSSGFRLGVKSMTGAAEHVFIDTGTVRGAEGVSLPGKPVVDTRSETSICFRIMVFDQEMAQAYADNNLDPDPGAARFVLNVDQEGNIQLRAAGQLTTSVDNHSEYVLGRYKGQVDSSYELNVGTDYGLTARGKLYLSSGKGLEIAAGGDMTLRYRRLRFRGTNDDVRVDDTWRVRAGSTVDLESQGRMAVSSGQDLSITAGASNSLTVGGHRKTLIQGVTTLANLPKPFISDLTVLQNGTSRLRAEKGDIIREVGPAALPVGRLRISNDPLNPSQKGRVELSAGIDDNVPGTPSIKTGLFALASGAFLLGSQVNASVRGTPAGTIQIGPQAGVGGYVVTSASHRCYITGLPPAGAPNVTVVQTGPGIPAPTVPVPDSTPNLSGPFPPQFE